MGKGTVSAPGKGARCHAVRRGGILGAFVHAGRPGGEEDLVVYCGKVGEDGRRIWLNVFL